MFGNAAPAHPEVLDDRFRQLVESIEDYAIYMLDIAGHVVTWNRGAALNKGYSATEILGKHYRIFFVPEDVAADVPGRNLREAKKAGRFSGEGWRLRRDGQRFWAGFVVTAMRDANGKLTGFAKVTRDLTERKRHEDAMLAMETALREERDTLRAASESSMEALFICAALRGADGGIEDFVFTYLNSNVETMASLPRGSMLGARLCELFPAVRAQGIFDMYKQVAETGQLMKHEFPNDAADPSSRWTRVRAVKLRDGIAITACDITERKRHEASLLHRAHHDHLTGLPNRALLTDRLGLALERAKRYGAKTAVFLVDLDGFKRVNDTLGHAAGDAVLVTASVRLQAAVRGTDSVLRIGGDEFVIVMPEIPDLAEVAQCGEKVLASLRQPMEIEAQMVALGASIGIAVYPDTGATIGELLKQADCAMYVAKRRGKNLLVFYACEFEEAPPRREEAIAAPAPTPAYGSCDQVKC
jgi:diguanylate cyclase (GGDEF)-like protein/PAS domain S-box-containing protein